MLKRRMLVLYISLLALSSLGIAYFFMQLVLGQEPCPLCIIDRYAMGIVGLVGLFCWQVYPSAQRIWFAIMMLTMVIAMLTAANHVYLEWFPYQADSCFIAPAENSLADFFINAFVGRSDCSFADWRFLGISLAEMTLVFFILLFVLLIYTVFIAREDDGDLSKEESS